MEGVASRREGFKTAALKLVGNKLAKKDAERMQKVVLLFLTCSYIMPVRTVLQLQKNSWVHR